MDVFEFYRVDERQLDRDAAPPLPPTQYVLPRASASASMAGEGLTLAESAAAAAEVERLARAASAADARGPLVEALLSDPISFALLVAAAVLVAMIAFYSLGLMVVRARRRRAAAERRQ